MFMVRVAVVAWIVVTAFVLGLLMLPLPWNFLLWVPYGIALPLGIIWTNRRQQKIRSEEAEPRVTDRKPP
jgi:membrane protein implicated in regulation of membrane protease activity